MSTAFAAAEARLGASVLKRLGNASITLADTTVVDGMLRNTGREATVGMGIAAREIEFECASASVSALAEGGAITLTYRGTSTPYLVAELFPADVHLQTTTLALRKAS